MNLAKPVGPPEVRFVSALYGCVKTAPHCLSNANRAPGPDRSEKEVYNSTCFRPQCSRELLHSHFDQIPATLTGITHDVTAGTTGGVTLHGSTELCWCPHCCNVLVTGALPRSFDNRQRVGGSSGHLRLAAAARLSLSPLTFSCSCFGARLRTELSLKVRVNKGVHNLRPAQSEQAIPAAGGHITGFPGKYRCAASTAAHTATG